MSSNHIPATGSPEDFLARLADVAPVAGDTEQMHVAAALAAVREAGVTAQPGRRPALRPTVPFWRKPRMAFSNALAILAGLSLPAKAAAATAATAVAIGGAAVTGTLPTPPEAAEEGLTNATEQSGVDVPANGQPESRPVGGDDEAGDERVDGQTRAEEARGTNNDHGEATSTEARAKADAQREAAAAKAAEARAAAEAAEERRAAAQERRAAAEAQRQEAEREAAARAAAAEREEAARAAAQERRQQQRDNADTTDDNTDTDASGDQSSTGTDRSNDGRAKADGARGR